MLREGEPCKNTGCLNHRTHPCEGCGRVGGRYVIEYALESEKYGVYITYDGDKQEIKFGSYCSHCGKYFEDENIGLYCDKCKRL